MFQNINSNPTVKYSTKLFNNIPSAIMDYKRQTATNKPRFLCNCLHADYRKTLQEALGTQLKFGTKMARGGKK